jgi:UDP-2,3-diacylglucosamine pyrophosphatase LpxH
MAQGIGNLRDTGQAFLITHISLPYRCRRNVTIELLLVPFTFATEGIVVINRANRYRAGWISDVHLGTRGSNAVAFLAFLKENDFDTLYIVGDLIDIWSLKRGIYWPQEHNDVIQKILRKARKGTRIIYIPGNHDEFLASHLGAYGAITIQKHALHITADGRRILVLHGHELDTVVQNIKWLALLGDLGYQFLLALNPLVNAVRRIFGFGYWSLSKAVKQRVKDAVSFIGAYEDAIVRYAERYNVQGVLCGHIHSAIIRQSGDTTYYNCGDWVENCSALVEHDDGRIKLLTNWRPAILERARPIVRLPRRFGLDRKESHEKEPHRAPGEGGPRSLSGKIIDYRSC